MNKRTELREYSCWSCPHNLTYNEFQPKKQFGVSMHIGERFCTGSKRARRFRSSDPKRSVPAWCPKRKEPREVRIYRFKDTEAWIMHENLCEALGRELPPEGHRYAVEYELTTLLSAKEFWQRCEVETDAALLGAAVHLHHVVEIDNGLQPAFFYKTTAGYRYEPFFNVAQAKKNKLTYEEDDA